MQVDCIYWRKPIFFFEVANSEQTHSILSETYSGIILQMKPFSTNLMRTLPCLSLSSLHIISYSFKENCVVGKLPSNLVSFKIK